MKLPVIDGAAVRLRPFRWADRTAAFALFGDPQVARYWSSAAWTRQEQADEWIERLAASAEIADDASHPMLPWAIADRATDEMIGTTTIYAWNREQARAELGFSLLRSHWGKGLAREAALLALVYGFDELKLRRFEADVDPRNTASLGLIERLGFVREGYARERWYVAGETCDAVLFGMLARELRR